MLSQPSSCTAIVGGHSATEVVANSILAIFRLYNGLKKSAINAVAMCKKNDNHLLMSFSICPMCIDLLFIRCLHHTLHAEHISALCTNDIAQ